MNYADNRAVGNDSALFEHGMPGELAQVLVNPMVRLTGDPTGRHGAADACWRWTPPASA